MHKPLNQRRNLLQYPAEHWRPPFYYSSHDRWAKIKSLINHFFDLQKSTILGDLEDELPQVRGTALDAGCGIQPYRYLFSPEVRYIGLDTADSKAHFGYETPDTLYFSGTTWPLENQTVDFILCTETLEHIPTPLVFLKEAFRCLRPGGRILLTIPFEARWHFIPFDFWRFTPSGLELILKDSGFSDIKVFGRGNQLTVVCYKSMAFIYSLMLPVQSNIFFEWLCRFFGFLGLPLFLLAAVLANLTLGKEGPVDCLGYTVIAAKAAPSFPGKD